MGFWQVWQKPLGEVLTPWRLASASNLVNIESNCRFSHSPLFDAPPDAPTTGDLTNYGLVGKGNKRHAGTINTGGVTMNTASHGTAMEAISMKHRSSLTHSSGGGVRKKKTNGSVIFPPLEHLRFPQAQPSFEFEKKICMKSHYRRLYELRNWQIHTANQAYVFCFVL